MRTLPLILASICLTGCVNSLVMDTGRAVPPGETEVTAGFGGGWQTSEITSYVTTEARGVDEVGIGEDPVAEERVAFPLTPTQFEWFYRWSRGTGRGFQVDLSLTMPTPIGLGGGLGLKWQIPLPSRTFAASVVARGMGSFGGTSSAGAGGVLVHGSLDPGLILSIHAGGDAIYLSPRVRWDAIYNRQWSDDAAERYSADARSWSAALGWRISGLTTGDVVVEAQAIYTPQTRTDDGLRVIFGFAHAGDF